mgnify:CR=1 FL=1
MELDFPYSIVRSQRKTAAIHVTPKGVQVRIPYQVTDAFALSFLKNKQSWVKQKLGQQSQQLAKVPKLALGESILWYGEEKKLVYQQGNRKHVFLQSDLIIVEGPQEPDAQQLNNQLEAFFKNQAKLVLPALTRHVATKLKLDDRLSQIRFRRTKSKWGHCTNKGVIQFNWLILGAPEDVIYYLVCHEVSHLKHHNHGRDFWNLVNSICPHVKASEAWLKENGIGLDWVA